MNIVKNVLAAPWTDSSGDEPANFKDLEVVFSNILGLLIPFAGIAIFVMIMIGGFKYMTSGGDPKKAAEGASTLTWAVIGLIVLVGAWFILRLISEFTGVDVTIFKIPGN